MEDNFTRIEAYLDGLMDENTVKSFEEEMVQNPALAREVEAEKMFRNDLQFALAARDVENAMKLKAQQPPEKSNPYLKYGAVFLVLLAGLTGLFVFWNKTAAPAQHPTPTTPEHTAPLPAPEATPNTAPQPAEKPMAQVPEVVTKPQSPIASNTPSHKSKPEETTVMRGGKDGSDIAPEDFDRFETLMSDYAPIGVPQKEFSVVLQLLQMKSWSTAQQRLDQMPESEASNYLSAICALHMKQPEKAEKSLYSLLKSGNTYKQEAQYLLGWCYFLKNEKESAAAIFSKFKNTNRKVPI